MGPVSGATSLFELILKKWGDDAAKVAAPAAGVMAAGQSEDAEAGFITKAGKTLLEAWHGSPHKFDKFSMDQIGTGEGAQAYGHGLYFADSEDVARGYRDSLTQISPTALDGFSVPDSSIPYLQEVFDGDDPIMSSAASELLAGDFSPSQIRGKVSKWAEIEGLDAAEALSSYDSMLKKIPGEGSLYRTEIDVTPESLLDWYKPLSDDTPQQMRDSVNALVKNNPDLKDALYQAYREGQPGSVYYSLLSDYAKTGDIVKNQQFATQQLNDAGIKGIKYLDSDSRAVGDGTSNYVIFDDSLINIAERGNADPRLLAGTAAGTAGLLAAPMLADKDKPLPVPTGGDIAESVLNILGMPMTGLQGISRGLFGLATGEDFTEAAAQAGNTMDVGWKDGRADVRNMNPDKGADQLEGYVTEKTGDESLGWLAKMGLLLGGI